MLHAGDGSRARWGVGRGRAAPGEGARRWTAAMVAVLALSLASACSGSGSEDGSDPAGGGGATSAGATDGGDAAGGEAGSGGQDGAGGAVATEPVDVPAALSVFEPPPEDTGLPAAQPEECPGADPEPFLSVFPEASPYQATSLVQDPPDALEDETHLQCRMSYVVELIEGDECTVMEVRDVVFTPEAEGVVGANDGTLTTTSVMTYFAGGARRDGIALDYTLSAGCDEASDLSDLESQFRAVWEAHRDRFLATPAYERP